MGELLRQEPVPFLDTEDNSQLVYSLFLRAELALKESKDADSLLVHLLETKRDEFKAVISAMSCDYDEPLIVLLWINAKRGEFLLAEEQARHAVLHKKPRK